MADDLTNPASDAAETRPAQPAPEAQDGTSVSEAPAKPARTTRRRAPRAAKPAAPEAAEQVAGKPTDAAAQAPADKLTEPAAQSAGASAAPAADAPAALEAAPRTRRRRPRADAPAPADAASAKSVNVAPVAQAVEPASQPSQAAEPVAPEAPEAPAADADERSARRSKAPAKPVSEMGVEELLESFPRRRRGRPSKKDQMVRDALKAVKADPTAENLDRARAAVASALGVSAPRGDARPVVASAAPAADAPEAPVPASEAPEAALATEAPSSAAEAAERPVEGENPEGGLSPRRRRRDRRDRDRARGEAPAQQQDAAQQGEASGQGESPRPGGFQRTHEREHQRADRNRNDRAQGQGGQGGQQGGNGNGQRDRNRNDRDVRPGRGFNQQGGQRDRNDRKNNRNGRNEPVAEPKASRAELEELTVGDLRAKAAELGIEATGLKKAELIDAVYAGLVRQEGFFDFRGILDLTNDGFGYVRTKGYLASENDVYIAPGLVRANGLRRGDELVGIARAARPNDKFPGVARVYTVNGKTPDELRGRPRFGDLTPVFPSEPLKMEHGKDSILGRCIDLVAPIGKGQRGLIVSPPKAGKTTVLKKIAESIAANNPEVHLICLLVDERPEEVTDMQRSIRGEVVASTFDMPCDNHITVSELVIERAKRLVEQGEDVVILLDSITRLARAYNLAQPASGRILSGGVDSTALYPPKRFLGAARNIEDGGSLTILASALVDTGSKMDEVIFEEFKGTGNMELKLDRDLADRRIFPAIDPIASGTRKEELLLDPGIAPFVWGIRRILAGMNSNERAMASLIKSLKATATNEEFLVRSAKKAQMQEMNGDF